MTACDKFEQAILEFGVKAAIEYFDAPEYVAKRLNANWEKQVRESENEDRAIIQQKVQPDNGGKCTRPENTDCPSYARGRCVDEKTCPPLQVN